MLNDASVSSMMRARAFSSAGENEPPSVARPRMLVSGRFHRVCSVGRVGRTGARAGDSTGLAEGGGSESDRGPRMTGSEVDAEEEKSLIGSRIARTRGAPGTGKA